MSKRSQALDDAHRRATALHAAGRLAEAKQRYRQILAAAPDHAATSHMLGVLALQTGHPADALRALDAALAADPRPALVHANRANALLALNRPAEAEAACREALRRKPTAAEPWASLGHALSDQGRATEAIAAYQRALVLNPRLPELHTGLGMALHDAARLAEAEAAFAEAARRAPGDPIAAGNLAGVLKDRGRLAEAEAAYRAILARHPDDAGAHLNLGILLLLTGRYAAAWPEWDWRFRAEATARPLPGRRWTGEALAGRTLLVAAEQGMGDLIHFARFLPLLPRDGRVVLEAHPPLTRLLGTLQGVDMIVPLGNALPPAELHCPIMSLPRYLPLAARPEQATAPYLSADPAAVAAWRTRLAALPGRRVGLAWAGNPGRVRMDRRRSIPPALLAPLGAVPGVSFVSLQKPLPEHAPEAPALFDPAAGLGDFADTAALIMALDLVIAVDTAVAHLAGALGRPVWLLNRFDTDWRWGLGHDDSAWYPSLRQFRQPRPGDWPAVVAAVAAALRAE